MLKETSKATVRDFAGYTSLHGFGRLADSKYILQKLAWICLTLAAFGMCIVQVYRLTLQYQNFQVNTKVQLRQEKQPFPKVTFCNLNPVKFSALVNEPTLFQIVDLLSAAYDINLTSFKRTFDHEYPIYNYTEEFAIPPLTGNSMEPLLLAQRYFQTRFSAMATDKVLNMSQAFDEFVLSCTFKGSPCQMSDIETFRSDTYGICYSFTNTGLVTGAGKANGLELILNVEQNEYTPFLTQSAGIVYEVSDKNYPSSIETNGVDLPVGTENNVGLKTVKHKRLPGPPDLDLCDETNRYVNVLSCLDECLKLFVIDLCQCLPPNTLGIDLPPCLSTDEIQCMDAIIFTVDTGSSCLYCKLPCLDTTYEKVTSMTTWPSGNYEPVLERLTREVMQYHNVKEDLLLFRVFFSTLLTETIEEEAAYTDENFVSDIGGQLGLWIGMSVLSIAEIVELVVLLCVPCCSAKVKSAVTESSSEDDTSMNDLQHNKKSMKTISMLDCER